MLYFLMSTMCQLFLGRASIDFIFFWGGGPSLKKEGIERIVLVEFFSSHCWKLQALQPLFHQEAEMKTSIH